MNPRLPALPVALLVALSFALHASVAVGQSEGEDDGAAAKTNESPSANADQAERQSSDDASSDQQSDDDVSPTDYVTPTEEQADLNTRAVESIANDEYEKAVDLLEKSLEIGEINITYLNLGRAYQRLRQCETAEKAYTDALSAPPVESPSPYLVEKKIEEYMEELETECQPMQEESSGGVRGMLRGSVGIAGGTSRIQQPGEEFLGGPDFNYQYGGNAWLLEFDGGLFVNQYIALHAGLGWDFQLAPTRTVDAESDEIEVEDNEAINGTSLFRLTTGVTAYVPAGAYLGYSLGLGWIGFSDPGVSDNVDLSYEMGFAMSTKLGWNIAFNDHFGLDIAAYWDWAAYLPETQDPNRFYGALGLLLGGTVRLGG